jgi:hypothetical protein
MQFLVCSLLQLLFWNPPLGKDMPPLVWTNPLCGLEIARVRFPFRIFCGDSSVTLFRIQRRNANLGLYCASFSGTKAITAEEWAVKEKLSLVFNAGMYLPGTLKSRGQMKLKGSWNQRKCESSFGGLFGIGSDTSKPFSLTDKTCEEPANGVSDSFFECMRMLDCKGAPVSWEKKKQRCSMLVAAEDSAGNLVLAFCRSPMLHSEMLGFLAGLPLGLKNALYLEGGPETSIYLRLPDGTSMKWIGTYVSETWERCDNQEFRKLPNVVGINFCPVSK